MYVCLSLKLLTIVPLQKVGKVAGVVGTLAVAAAGVPAPAAAAAAAAKNTVTAASDAKKLYAVAAASFSAGVLVSGLLSNLGGADPDMVRKINRVFSGSLSNSELVSSVEDVLKDYGYGKSSLVATSLCADEVNRVLEKDFSRVYTDNFSMGGLAGFPFGGVTAFGAMASHIPDGGSCLVVFGPHVGVDHDGSVGTVERRGRENGGACCGSAVAASNYVASVYGGDAEKAAPPKEPKDAQQNYVGNMLLPHAARLDKAPEKMVELPFALYDAQKKLMDSIVQAGCGAVAGSGKIAVLGGIQINTPPGKEDYFLPLSFELFDNKGKLVRDLLPAL